MLDVNDDQIDVLFRHELRQAMAAKRLKPSTERPDPFEVPSDSLIKIVGR